MTIAEIKELAMFQIGNDAEDLADYLPYVDRYLDEGYDLLAYALAKVHPVADNEEYPLPITDTALETVIPVWTHKALADYVTWCLYRNGNTNKQQRGFQFLSAFREVLAQVRSQSDARTKNFYNIPR